MTIMCFCLQVVLDCPLDACFTYIYQFEPYLKDPVGFPKFTVSFETEKKFSSVLWFCVKLLLILFAADAGVFILRRAPGHRPPLRSEHPWMQLDVGLVHLLCRSHGSGNCVHVFTDADLLENESRFPPHCDLFVLFCPPPPPPRPTPQTQWCHIGASLHSRTPFTYRVPADKKWLVIALNVLLAVAPALLALRCLSNPAFFTKPAPEEQSNNEKKEN